MKFLREVVNEDLLPNYRSAYGFTAAARKMSEENRKVRSVPITALFASSYQMVRILFKKKKKGNRMHAYIREEIFTFSSDQRLR